LKEAILESQIFQIPANVKETKMHNKTKLEFQILPKLNVDRNFEIINDSNNANNENESNSDTIF